MDELTVRGRRTGEQIAPGPQETSARNEGGAPVHGPHAGAPGLEFEGEVRTPDVSAAAELRRYVARRLRSALRPYRGRVSRVAVRVLDVNGPKGGVDTRCSITAVLQGGRRVFVHAISASPHGAVSLAARRLTRIVGRVMQQADHAGDVSRHEAGVTTFGATTAVPRAASTREVSS